MYICRSGPDGPASTLLQSGSIVFDFRFLFICLLRASSTQPVLPVLLHTCVFKMRFSTLVSAAAFFELSIAGYVLEDDYMTDFYSNFNFFTGPDPTLG